MKGIGVLIVDDERICVDGLMTEIRWEALGISPDHVYGAYSVRQAKNIINDHMVNIVICDIEMPNENGLDFIEMITERTRLTEDPVECIMLTCHPEYAFIRRALQLGCLDYVLKPMEPEEVEEVLKKAVANIEERNKKIRTRSKLTGLDTYENVVYGKIIPFIEENLTSSFSVETIADHVGLNPQYMMRLFKKETGRSILVFVTGRRMEIAKEMLLKTDWSIENITEKIGYVSPAHFSSLFKRVEGISPGQYRKKYR